MKKLFWQFIKFGIVGLSNTAVSFLVYYTLLWAGVHYLIASAAGFALSVLNAYFWSKKFVFTQSTSKNQLAKVYISYGATFVLSLCTMFIMVDNLGISQLIAPVLNLFITVPLNFLLNKFWVFKG